MTGAKHRARMGTGPTWGELRTAIGLPWPEPYGEVLAEVLAKRPTGAGRTATSYGSGSSDSSAMAGSLTPSSNGRSTPGWHCEAPSWRHEALACRMGSQHMTPGPVPGTSSTSSSAAIACASVHARAVVHAAAVANARRKSGLLSLRAGWPALLRARRRSGTSLSRSLAEVLVRQEGKAAA